MSNRWWIISSLLLVLCMTFACTEADLCEDDSHDNHGGDVRVGFVWPHDSTPPDSMYILAVRIINHRKFGMVVATDNLRGHYFYNAPSTLDAWVDPSLEPEPEPEPDPTTIGVVVDPEKPYNGGVDPNNLDPTDPDSEEPSVPSDQIQVDHFSLPFGTYNFLTVNTDSITAVYRNFLDYLEAEGTGMQYGEVGVEYRTFAMTDEKIIVPGKNYQDYNQGFGYILTESPAIYIDRVEQVEIGEHVDMDLKFQPRMLTQNLDIYLDVQKDLSSGDAFVVDSVIAEVSGIPIKAGLFNGHLNLNHTCKMLFRTTLEDANGNPIVDTNTNTALRVHGNINVLSILRSASATDRSGPGIMQVALYTHSEKVDDNGVLLKGPSLRKQISVNMYNALTEANLITYSDDYQYATKSCDHAVVNIDVTAIIKGSGVVSSGGEGGGIHDWTTDDENQVNDDINGDPIEL